MNAGNILSKDLEKVLDLLEYRFEIRSNNGQQLSLEFEDLRRADIEVEPFAIALHHLKELMPQIKIKNVFDFVNEDPSNVYQETGTMPTLAEVIVPVGFKDLLQKFRKDHNITTESRKKTLTGMQVSFDTRSSVLAIGDFTCQLPPTMNEDQLCRVLFSHDKGKVIDWSEIAMQTSGLTFEQLDLKKHKRPIQDTMYAVNQRVKKNLNTDDNLFSWEKNTIRRNF